MNVGGLNKVWEIKALKKVGEDEARKILDRIAKQVQPIMRKHKWRVKLASLRILVKCFKESEFFIWFYI